ncbi:hypothetical protein GCM10027161_57950 [Microbispora hainanensis]
MVTDSDGKADTPKGQADWKKERETVLSPKSPTPGVMWLPIPGTSLARLPDVPGASRERRRGSP